MFKTVLVVLAFLGTAFVSQGQTKAFVQADIATSNGRMYESVELGATTGKNRLSFVGESYNLGDNFTFNSDREYFAGIKYTRGVSVGKRLDLLMSCAAKMHIDDAKELSIEPGIGLALNLSKTLSLTTGVSSPIHQNTTPFKSMQLKAGVGVQVRI